MKRYHTALCEGEKIINLCTILVCQLLMSEACRHDFRTDFLPTSILSVAPLR